MVRLKHRYLLMNILYPTRNTKSVSGLASTDWETQNFLKFHSPSPAGFDERALARLIRDSVGELFGDYGAGKVGGNLKVIYLSTATSTAIVRVSRDHVQLVWAALSFINKLPKPFDNPCIFHVVRNSGTIRLAEDEAIKRARDFVRRARSVNAGQSLNQVLRNAVEAEVQETGGGLMAEKEMTDSD